MKGEKMLIGLGYIDRKFIEESENDTIGKRSAASHPTVKHRPKKPLLIAAAIGLMLLLMGCAAVTLLHLNELKIGEYTYTQYPRYEEDGTTTPAAEKAQSILSLQGVAGSPNQQAAKEWFDFIQADDPGESAPAFIAPDDYDAYGVTTQGQMDKVAEICEKYGLKPAGKGALLLTQAQDRMEEILGISGIFTEDAPAQATYVGGRFYACGNFNLDYRVSVQGLPEISLGYSYGDKAYFSTARLALEEGEPVQEWNYTTRQGANLLLVKTADRGYLFCDREDAFLQITLGSGLEPLPEMTRAEMEEVAEVLDYALKPQKPGDMQKLAEELEQLYSALTPVDDEEAARRQAEYALHQQHDSFGALIADIRENEAYFTTYCGIIYDDFQETMEYCLMDANGDGEEDLLLGRDGNVSAIWTMQDGKTHALCGCWAQGHLCQGYVYEFSVQEDGGHFHSYTDLRTGEDLGQVSYQPCDGIWYFQQEAQRKAISEAEAFAFMDSHTRIPLPEMKPVTEFPMD